MFIACADNDPASGKGAHVYNLHGATVAVSDIIATIEEQHPSASNTLQQAGPEIPIPAQLDGSAIHRDFPGLPDTPLSQGIGDTLKRFNELHKAGKLDTRDLPKK
jgi:hypothetical protein